jgi:cytoskeletal protein CcmA (bactofilin family)
MEPRDIKTTIGEDIEIVGSVKCQSHIQLNGKLSGDLTCNGDAVLGNTGSVTGNTTVNSMTVYGQVTGNITARDRIEFKSSARINGDIKAKRLAVEDGASFVGKAEVNPSALTSKSVPDSSAHEILPGNEGLKDMDSKNRSSSLFGRK